MTLGFLFVQLENMSKNTGNLARQLTGDIFATNWKKSLKRLKSVFWILALFKLILLDKKLNLTKKAPPNNTGILLWVLFLSEPYFKSSCYYSMVNKCKDL